MGQYTSYYYYQKYEKRGEGDWVPVYPNEYSVDGNGTMPLSVKNENDPACGYNPSGTIYRWINMDISQDWYCSGTTKYYKQQKQVSYDSGSTWENVSPAEYQWGSSAQTQSTDCGYGVIERWVNSGTTCSGESGYDKYYLQVKQTSTDGGQTWTTTTDTRLGSLIQVNSTDCGYVPPTGYSNQYLTFVALDDCWFYLEGGNRTAIKYSLNSGTTWNDAPFNAIPVSAGNKILWKGGLSPVYSPGGFMSIGIFKSSGRFNVEGNLSSIISGGGGDYFTGNTEISNFGGLFCGCTGLTSAENLILPATTLRDSCYSSMFSGCTSLTSAPALPATTLAWRCYDGMFDGCTSLASAPELPATTLAESCYGVMFYGCTSLTTAPELPATTLAKECYWSMFGGCSSLTTAPQLPATTLADYCYRSMFAGCTGLTTVPSNYLPATVLKYECYRSMFSGCTSLTSAPELPATTLERGCYSYMFEDCTSLTTAPSSIGTTSTTFIMEASACTSMFSGCTSLTSAPELPARTLRDSCYRSMFYGCTSLTSAPELPARTLADYCYSYMFEDCTNLSSITCLATDKSASQCTYNWLNGVASNGTFIKNSYTTWSRGIYGIPSGWTVVDYSG